MKRENGEGICARIHRIARGLRRFRFPFDDAQLPPNGVYILFEQGEEGHEGERIVRVGTHTGQDNLPARLREHFETPNKDRSIFRKNIGRALLSRRKDQALLGQWNHSLTRRADRELYGESLDRSKLDSVEAEVREYIKRRFTFAVMPVNEKLDRLALESGLIASVAQCCLCTASTDWLGNYSPKRKIRRYGLWQEQHVEGQGLDELPESLAALAPLGKTADEGRPTACRVHRRSP
jgi:hypothetical protein